MLHLHPLYLWKWCEQGTDFDTIGSRSRSHKNCWPTKGKSNGQVRNLDVFDCNKSFTTAPAEAAVDAERADEFDHSEFSRLVLHNRVE